MRIRTYTGISLFFMRSSELLCFILYLNTLFCPCIPWITWQICLKIMKAYILFWFVSEWAFWGIKISVWRWCIWVVCRILFFADNVFWVQMFFVGNLSCLYVYSGNLDYLFFLIVLFLWYEFPIYLINIWI